MREADVQLRYAPIVHWLQQHRGEILEVGGGVAGIAQFLKRPITGCDPYFSKRKGRRAGWQGLRPLANIKPVGGTATRIPFPNGRFPVVIASDMLEHLPRSQRGKAIREMLRVSSRYLVLSFPCGAATRRWELRLFRWGKQLFGKEHRWIKEHIAYGVPQESEVTKYLNGLAFQKQGNGNVWLWVFMTAASAIARPLGWLLYPFARWVQIPPHYRTLIIIRK